MRLGYETACGCDVPRYEPAGSASDGRSLLRCLNCDTTVITHPNEED